ncbi:MAG: hypothetical protein FWG29_06350 [Treponema sp.]|nr:hypothetical protein [Treponema sp.]
MTRRNLLLCLVWIGSALLIGFLLWFFTLSYRTRLLTQKVNKALAQSGVTAGGRIEKISGVLGGPSSVLGGSWFMLGNSFGGELSPSNARPAEYTDRAFVFTMIQNGIAAACVALVDSENKVRSIIPLSENARQITDELRLPIYRFYVDRIERAARRMNLKERASR